MGFNYSACGYATVDDFVAAMKAGESGQLDAFLGHCKKTPGMVGALQAKTLATTTSGSRMPTRSTEEPSMGRRSILPAAWLCAVLFAASSFAEPPAPRLRSGIFEGLMLAVDPQGGITGYYREEQGEGVVKRCSFFLAGKVAAGATPVMTWGNQRFPGTLTPLSDGVELRIKQGSEHPGCGLVLPPLIASGLGFDLVRETSWRELRRVVDKRVNFHSAPSEAKKLRAFVVAGDVVGVIAESGEWLEVEYPGTEKTTRGWVRAAATQKLTAPAP
jgi:hypothetical protein